MKELLQPLAAYNLWANQRLIDAVTAVPPELQTQAITSSFDSLHKTLLHMLDAESIWWQRMKMQERIIIPSENAPDSTEEVGTALINQSKQWLDWTGNASELALEHVFHYHNLKGELFKMPVFQMLQHIFNHGTYHRGQLITLLRQVGVTKLPQTDFSFWLRTKK